MIDQKLGTVRIFQLFGSMIRNGARCTREVKSTIAMAKGALNREKTLFTRKMDLNVGNKLVTCYIWSTVFYGAEAWTLRTVDQKYRERFLNVVLEKNGDHLARMSEK